MGARRSHDDPVSHGGRPRNGGCPQSDRGSTACRVRCRPGRGRRARRRARAGCGRLCNPGRACCRAGRKRGEGRKTRVPVAARPAPGVRFASSSSTTSDCGTTSAGRSSTAELASAPQRASTHRCVGPAGFVSRRGSRDTPRPPGDHRARLLSRENGCRFGGGVPGRLQRRRLSVWSRCTVGCSWLRSRSCHSPPAAQVPRRRQRPPRLLRLRVHRPRRLRRHRPPRPPLRPVRRRARSAQRSA